MTHIPSQGEGTMSEHSTDIPDDIRKAAEAVAEEAQHDSWVVDSIAAAILAERKRCIAEIDHFLSDIQISVDGRSRFDIYDINRQAKKAVRYVRDRISGDYDKNWYSVPSDHPSLPTPDMEKVA